MRGASSFAGAPSCFVKFCPFPFVVSRIASQRLATSAQGMDTLLRIPFR